MGCFRLHIESESNLRVAYSIKTEKPLKKTVHYYPFGLKHKEYNNVVSSNGNSVAQKNMYNQGTTGTNFQGKVSKSFKVERQEELGLNLDMTKFRMYDYALGRFTSIDPLADTNPQESWTPYQYTYNSPIQYNDPYGDCPPWICGAILGAIVHYGMQVAGNMAKGKSFTESLTSDISLSSIVTAAGEGALTAGGGVMRRILVSGAKTVIDNTIDVRTSTDGSEINTVIETNAGNVVKNTIIDMGTDAIINEVVPTKLIKQSLYKVGVIIPPKMGQYIKLKKHLNLLI